MKSRKRRQGLSKNDKKSKSREALKFAVVLILFWFYVVAKEKTIGYPDYLFNLAFGIILLVLLVTTSRITISEFKDLRGKIDKVIYAFFYIVKTLFISFFLSGIVLIPFNLYNRYYSKRNAIEIIKCEITGLSDYSRNSCFYYSYKGEVSIIYAHRQIMSDIYINKSYQDYLFIAKVRKGLLDTYLIESWDFVHK